MSSSDEIVIQKKGDNDTVTWREYEALRDHLLGIFDRNASRTDGEIQGVRMQVTEITATVTNMQGQVTDLQTSIQQLTQSVNALRATVEQRQPVGHGDNDSVQGENEDPFGVHANANANANAPGRGRGIPNGRRPPLLGAQHVPLQEDDGLGKPKFSIPKFEGSTDVEEYLTWELKMEKLWRLHDYTEERKIKLASSEFDGYALRWWDNLVQQQRDDNGVPVLTWAEVQHQEYCEASQVCGYERAIASCKGA